MHLKMSSKWWVFCPEGGRCVKIPFHFIYFIFGYHGSITFLKYIQNWYSGTKRKNIRVSPLQSGILINNEFSDWKFLVFSLRSLHKSVIQRDVLLCVCILIACFFWFHAHYQHTVYPKKCAHGFVVLCFVVVTQSFIMNSHEVFIHIHQGCFAGTGAIVRLPQCQWSKPDGYGKITTTKHSNAKTVCIFLGIYCRYCMGNLV